jgi:tRNA-(ms[2]io[6]A)-hydroxylase
MLRLRSRTDPAYVDTALGALDRTLVDHAHCEHKAAVTALSFVSKYPDDPVLVVQLSALAHEEAGHFAQLAKVCADRGLALGHPEPDAYVQRLLAAVRKQPLVANRVDRLLVCALIEGRSCERLHLLADGLRARNDALAPLYDGLWREEAGHHTLFVDLAVRSLARTGVDERAARAAVDARLDELAALEADIVASLPLRPAIH